MSCHVLLDKDMALPCPYRICRILYVNWYERLSDRKSAKFGGLGGGGSDHNPYVLTVFRCIKLFQALVNLVI